MEVAATDGDEHVMDLLRRNAAHNAASKDASRKGASTEDASNKASTAASTGDSSTGALRVAPLRWGDRGALEACGLTLALTLTLTRHAPAHVLARLLRQVEDH